MFIWLGVALIVDSIDGPLARRVHVTTIYRVGAASAST